MNRYWQRAAAIVALIALGAGAFFMGSQDPKQHADRGKPPHHLQLQGRTLIDLATAIDFALQRLPGEVLKVELENDDGRYVYEVKILAADGHVREVKLDATNGSLIEIEAD